MSEFEKIKSKLLKNAWILEAVGGLIFEFLKYFIDPLSRSWNNSFYYFFWICGIFNHSTQLLYYSNLILALKLLRVVENLAHRSVNRKKLLLPLKLALKKLTRDLILPSYLWIPIVMNVKSSIGILGQRIWLCFYMLGHIR